MKVLDAKSKELKTFSRKLKDSLNSHPIEVTNASHLHGLAAGLKKGEIMIEGDAGDYLGVLNAGATITVRGDVGNYVADNMTSGTLIIEGSTGYGAAQYCYGGTVVIRGNAGDFTATMNKGATILINGDVGSDAGTYMLDGDLIVVGSAGEHFANYLIRGFVYIRGEWASLGHNTQVESMQEIDIEKLQNLFDTYEISASPNDFKKIVAASEKPFYQ
jgi:glutamate synthase domain-containing protein 3